MATTVCATCVHTLCVARTIFFALFPCVTYRQEHAWLKVFAVCMCVCHISPSRPLLSHVSSAVFAVPAGPLRHQVPVCTFFVERYETQKRGSSAPPHVRQGVALPGRSHALNNSGRGFFFESYSRSLPVRSSPLHSRKSARPNRLAHPQAGRTPSVPSSCSGPLSITDGSALT